MAAIKIKPLADRVIIESAAAEEKTAGGLYIPDSAKEKPQKGKVVAVGTGKKDEPLSVKVGDLVLYGKYAGTEITVEGKDYLIMKEADIFAVLTK
ncbi:MAG: co-chaperone GroES [Flavobacteriales bacterium]